MKPQNILVSQFDEPVLADFGVATLQAQAQSTEGVFGFTTLHAPPEALEGLPLSASADIYGLASSMYQLLVGRGPFSSYEGEAPASVILRILRDPAPRAPANDVPVALADLMENALAKDPVKRPQSAGAFAEALREIEALAGWAQTPYVVWGAAQAASPSAEDDPEPPAPNPAAAPSPAAAQLAQLLQAERENLDRLPDPATEVTRAAPAPVTATAVEELVPEAGPPPAPPAEKVPAPQVPPAKAVAAPAKTRRPSSPGPKRAPQQPAPPGTRSVIAPEPQKRNVLAPLPATAQVRVVAPAEPVTPMSSWLTPLTGTQGAAGDRQWRLSALPAQTSRPDGPQPAQTRRLSSSGPGLHVTHSAARRKQTLVFLFALVAAVVLGGGLGLAALTHLL
jgi:hypothetical protein